MAVLFLIGRLQDLTSSCSKLLEILLFLISCNRLSVPKRRTFQKFGMSSALSTPFPNNTHCWIKYLHLKFKKHPIKERNCFMQELLWSFFSYFGNYGNFPVPAQNYLKYCFSQIVIRNSLFKKQENLKHFIRGKLF